MRTAAFVSLASALLVSSASAQSSNATGPVTGIQGNATEVLHNPLGATYVATLPATQFFNPTDPRGNVKGSITATSAPNGAGVKFTVEFSNLPTGGGPFGYHLHVLPVNASGSCAATLAHLDPFIRGEQPPCDPSLPQTCQVGDLSGKYGKITSDPFTASYVDPYVSLVPGLGSFFGNRSFVVHFANTTRITCASFVAVAGNGTGTTTSPPATFTGAANVLGASALMGAAGVVAALFL